jgi:hypothetical protein
MKIMEHIVREQAYHLWNQSEQFWLAAKAEFYRIEGPPWLTEEAATERRTRNLLEDNPTSG